MTEFEVYTHEYRVVPKRCSPMFVDYESWS
jgi:hypothetical protein